MKPKHFFIVATVTFVFSFLLQGINDQNVFVLSRWRLNNVVNILHFWLTFLSTYYVFLIILNYGIKILNIDTPNKLIALLAVTQIIAFLWVCSTDILFYFVYYNVESLLETTFFEFDLPLAIVVLSLGSFYFYQKNVFKTIPVRKKNDDNISEKTKTIVAFQGLKKLLITPSQIAVLYLSKKMVWLKTQESEIYNLDLSISKLTEDLPSEDFFRINRQTIISRNVINGFKKMDYQKLEVILKTDLKEDINLVISKYNAPIFKKWLEQ
jgi:hypothetical protein